MQYLPNNTLLQGGKYKIVRFISAGGFGCTYEAISVVTGNHVAIKELFVKDVCDRDERTLTINAYSTNKSALLNKVKRKFLEEANALRQMQHPNIVKVYDSFEENGTAYYVMDYIEGASLHEIILRNGRLPEQVAVQYITQVADALEYVHRRNRLHLDIKPGNIMIDRHDNAILIDFGVSKQYDEVNGENTSTMMGKAPGYSPIEQLGNNVLQFSPATDIYALGATLYRCVTGQTPPDATTILTNGLPQLPYGISKEVSAAITQSMKPSKKDRPQSVKEFMGILTGSKNNDSGNNMKWYLLLFLIIAIIGAIIFNSLDNKPALVDSSNIPDEIRAETAQENSTQNVVEENPLISRIQSTGYFEFEDNYKNEGWFSLQIPSFIGHKKYLDGGSVEFSDNESSCSLTIEHQEMRLEYFADEFYDDYSNSYNVSYKDFKEDNYYVVSGYLPDGDQIYYRKIYYRQGYLIGATLIYPKSLKRPMDKVIKKVFKSFNFFD